MALSNIKVLEGDCEIHVVPNSINYNNNKNQNKAKKKQQKSGGNRGTQPPAKMTCPEGKNIDKPNCTVCEPYLDLVFFFLYILSSFLHKL